MSYGIHFQNKKKIIPNIEKNYTPQCIYAFINRKKLIDLMPSKGPYLLALLSGLDVDLGPFLEGLSQDMSDQRFTGNLHGHHVACAL